MGLEYSGLKWIVARAGERLEELHARLESPGLDIDSTNLLRGQIQEVRRILEDAKRAYNVADNEV